MSLYHCSCGFAIDDSDEYGDHLREVFDRGDGTGTDGLIHDEIDTGPSRSHAETDGGHGTGQRRHVCACGFATGDTTEFDDHALLVLIPLDGVGNDGRKHTPVNPATPDRWYIRETPDE